MKLVSILKYLFSIVGLGLLVSTYYIYKNTQDFLKSSQIARGTVVELVSSTSDNGSTLYRPTIEFLTDKGSTIQFTSDVSSNPPSYKKGEVVEVYYQKDMPQRAKVKGFFSLWGGHLIMGGMGFTLFMVGFSMVVTNARKNKKTQTLKATGKRIKAKIKHIGLNTSHKVNGRSPYQIHAQWLNPATNKVHIFKSEYLWFDPTDYVNEDEITVLIDRNNPKKYYVDVSFLPQLSE